MGLIDYLFGTRTPEQNVAQAAREQQWEQQYGAEIKGLEHPMLDPVDTVAGGLTSLPRGVLAAVADMGVDVATGSLMDSLPQDTLLAAATHPKTAARVLRKELSHAPDTLGRLRIMSPDARKKFYSDTRPVFKKATINGSVDPYYRSTSLVPTKTVDLYREFDRKVTPKWGNDPKLSLTEYNELRDSIAKNGINDPVILTYYPKEAKVLLTEGNHRLAIAKDLGIEDIPMRVFVSRRDAPSAAHKLQAKGFASDGHIPADLKPTQLGIDGVDLEDLHKEFKRQTQK